MTLRIFCFLSLCAAAFQAHSATFCVTTQQGLINAAAAAASSPEDDEIRLIGTIQINGPLELQINAGRTALRGGYSSDCITRNPSAMSNLVGDGKFLKFKLGNGSDLTIERLNFSAFSSLGLWGSASPTKGQVLISRSIFQNSDNMGLQLGLPSHDARVENSVFRNNSWGLFIQPFANDGWPEAEVDVVNCTAVNNWQGIAVTSGPSTVASNRPVRISNTISVYNDHDVNFAYATRLRFSIYRTSWSTVNLTDDSLKNWLGDPMLNAAHRPGIGSRAIDSGDNAVFGDPIGFIKLRDIYGNKRIENSFIDRGAVETSGSPFWGVF